MLSGIKYWRAGLLDQMNPPKPTFGVDQIPDLSGHVAIVTGGGAGIGYETSKALLQHHAKVYLCTRDQGKAERAIVRLKAEVGKDCQVIFVQLDLANLKSVKRAATELAAREHEVHILINNAGVMWSALDALTDDGYDMQFGTNVIGHFLFTELLMPVLLAGARASPDGHTRVVTVSSLAAYNTGEVWYDALRDGPTRRKLGTEKLYDQSKFANAVVARQIAQRYGEQGIVSISLNPGAIKTDLQRTMNPIARRIVQAALFPPTMGALTSLFAATMPEALNYNGEFMVPWARLGKCRQEMYDDSLGQKLWERLEDETKTFRD
ncbi:NAD(P)-binding protein [Epithele typhae]|uniref:NAD(P)-binding protein n=1 Tax=Epithele typhae TaxID=378194 RepID=UPI0020081BFD|nr:NAD(P)-binding protein [Epithele typhae]KAH9932805.1 NAD(P)-binding protein [Epithele typhae]